MFCRKIEVSQFRNIEHAAVVFDEGVNVLYGKNAEGKTNLLEAIYFAAIGKSFRGQSNSEVVRFDSEHAAISLDFFGQEREQNITVRLHRGKARTVEKNKVPIARMSDLVGSFRAVLFSPEHLCLIKDGPAERRQFLDIAISATEPLYLRSLQRYHQILKQRNALLKKAEENRGEFEKTIEIWSAQLAREGALIARYRKRYVEKAAGYVAECFAQMTGSREVPSLFYQSVAKEDISLLEDLAQSEKLLFQKLSTHYDREIAAGATLWGIHKDDIEVLLNGRAARAFCSQGQQRSLALALKLAEGELCREDCGEYPVFLFDDVLSELDRTRQSYLLQKMEQKQVIITTCEKEIVSNPKKIFVKQGTYTQE